jgi:hypothetical protein
MSFPSPRAVAALAAVTGLAATLVLPAGPAMADQRARHRTLVFLGSDAQLGLVDNAAPGASLGDVRTLGLTMRTRDGRRVGTADVVQTLTDEGDVDRAIKVVVLTLAKGTISAIGMTTFPDFLDPAARPDDETEHIAIVGGTGRFRGAEGYLDIVVRPGFRSTWIVHLDR